MTTSSIGYKAVVSDVPLDMSVHTRINIKKRKVRALFKTLTDDSRVNIAYIESQKSSPTRNLSVSDRSRSLVENAFFGNEDYVLLSTRVFTTRAKKFLVTDVFTTLLATQDPIPLFYFHLLGNFNPELPDFSDRELLTLEFIDAATMQPFNHSEYYFDSSTGKIYNNLANTYDSNQGLVASLVRYSVKVTTDDGSSVYSYQELVSNQTTFSQATIQDLDEWGNLISGRKSYLLESIPGGTYYKVTLPPGASYAYQEIAPSKIYVLPPVATDLASLWTVRVSNGEFMSAVRNGENTFRSSKYYLPEFLNQGFNPYYPYKYSSLEAATRVSSNLIKVSRNIVDRRDIGLFVHVRIYDSSGDTVESAFTTSEELVDTYVDSTKTATYKYLVYSIDALNGFIELGAYVPEDRKILVSYYTEADEYDFVDIDFNPVNNAEILDQKVVLYLNPETLRTGTLSKALHFLEVDRLGRISYCSQADDGGIDPSTIKLLAEDFDNDGYPKRDFYYDIESTASGLRSRVSGEFSIYQEDFSFIDKYTVETELARITAPSGEFAANLAENPGFLVLADIQVGESESPEISTKIDVRVRGGGIREGYDALAKTAEPESQFYWDKEFPYPGGTAFMVELPQSLLQEHGGDYVLDQLRALMGKHADFGGYPVTRTYGVDPVIASGIVYSEVLSGVVLSGVVQFVWTSYGDDVEYDVMMSTNKDIGFEAYNLTSIPNEEPTNVYTVSGLYPNITYYAYIQATKDGEISKGPKVKFTTSAYNVDGD